ncbi:BTAD domain-containing putative transcriptional regulator [Actinoplanes sp. NPDC023801]|uniref:AfsR/SARP family transcriptional regulator n=1 Tax=Actinoplanes sp. NPDC023801 TaxID=3154595 RepID=UPI0033C72C89
MRTGWQREYAAALAGWAHAEIDAGNAGVTIGRLSAALDRDPLDESAAAALIRALHAIGRVVDALTWYRRVRDRIVAEVGVEPGPFLRRVHDAVLRGAAVAAGPAGPAAATPDPPAAGPDREHSAVDRCHDLARALALAGHPDRALHHARQAAAGYRAAGDRTGEGRAYLTLGRCEMQLGDVPAGRRTAWHGLELLRDAGDAMGEADGWQTVGEADLHLGRHTDAMRCFWSSLTLYRRLGATELEAQVLRHLGTAYAATTDRPLEGPPLPPAGAGFRPETVKVVGTP